MHRRVTANATAAAIESTTDRSSKHSSSRPKLKLGVVCIVDGDPSSSSLNDEECQGALNVLEEVLIESLGGKDRVVAVKRAVMPSVIEKEGGDDDNDDLAERLAAVVRGEPMEGTNVIFAVVVSRCDDIATFSGSGGGSVVAFRAGLETSRALDSLWTKRADALAMSARRGAAAMEPVAALFEYAAGAVAVRSGGENDDATMAMLISCSDIGLEGAAAAIKDQLFHVVARSHR